jgi:hypothetical protein
MLLWELSSFARSRLTAHPMPVEALKKMLVANFKITVKIIVNAI